MLRLKLYTFDKKEKKTMEQALQLIVREERKLENTKKLLEKKIKGAENE